MSALLAIVFWGQVDRRYRDLAVLTSVTALIWLAYVVFIGGDIFPAWRHFVPVLVLMALSVVEGAGRLARQFHRLRWQLVLWTATAACLLWFVHLQVGNRENRRAIKERWEYDGQVVGTMLKHGFGEVQPLVAVTAAGCIPYWSGLPSLDMLGLNDYYLPRHRPESFGQGGIGHELRDDEYVLSRNPDLIIFNIGGDWMAEMTHFQDRYLLCHFEGRDPYPYRTAIWVNRTSRKVGAHREGSALVVPAYLLNGNERTTAYLNEAGRFVIAVTLDEPAWLHQLSLPPGRYRVELRATAPVTLSMSSSDTAGPPVAIEGENVFVVPANVTVRLELTATGDEPVEVEHILLHRLPE